MTDAPAPNPMAAYEAALKGAQAAETPQARGRYVAEMEFLAKQLPEPGSAPRADPVTGQPAPPTEEQAFPAPASAMEYQFHAPPGVEIMNETAAGALKAGLYDAGVPAPFAGEVFRHVAELHSAGAFVDGAAYDAALVQCKQALAQRHGEAAKDIVRDGVAYLNALADRNPSLEEAVAHAMASPYAVTMAANLRRYGTTRSS